MSSGPHMIGFGQHPTILTVPLAGLWLTNLRHFEGLHRDSDEWVDSMKLLYHYQLT